MSAFTGALKIEEIIPGRRWRLIDPIRYEAGAKGSGLWIEVPAGFETDGATLPPALRVLVAVWGTYGRAAALHDYLYALARKGAWQGTPLGMCASVSAFRAAADHEFRIAAIALGTRPALAWAMWLAVRLFGAGAVKPIPEASDGHRP